MSRYYDGDGDADPNFQNEWHFWQANARRALKGKRGRRVLAELGEALANLPDKRLISRALCTANPARREPSARVIPIPGEKPYVDDSDRREFTEVVEEQGEGVCAVGALLWWRKVKAGADPVDAFDQLPTLGDWEHGLEETATLASAEAGVVFSLAWQLAYRNDETFEGCTPEQRWSASGRASLSGCRLRRLAVAELPEPPVGSVVAAGRTVFLREEDDEHGAAWRKIGHLTTYGWTDVLEAGGVRVIRYGLAELPDDATEAECEREACQRIAATASDVYCEITGGLLSYPTYDARTVLAHADERTQELVDEECARVRAEALREVAQGLVPNHTRPSNWIVVGARMTDDALDAVRMVENALAAAVRAEAVAEERQRIAALEAALRYISSPTMGLPSGRDAAEFAMVGATEQNARLALLACIRTARTALAAGKGVGGG